MEDLKCQRFVLFEVLLQHIYVADNHSKHHFVITGAAQGCNWRGWARDHSISCHNSQHYSICLTQDLHCQQTIFLLHIPRRHKLSSVHGQNNWPHQKLTIFCVVWVQKYTHKLFPCLNFDSSFQMALLMHCQFELCNCWSVLWATCTWSLSIKPKVNLCFHFIYPNIFHYS